MSDAFKINWRERMKTDPQANSILNDKMKFQHFTTYLYYQNAGDPTVYYDPGQTKHFSRPINKLYSDHYLQDRAGTIINQVGWFRRGNDLVVSGNNPNKYWDNTIPQSIYNHNSIAYAENPKIENLNSLPVYQKRM